jgi:DNA processing protein
VGVVGSRAATPYGLGVAADIGAEACRVGLGVVSGLARGIDTEAHRGALDADGITLAVTATGLDTVYPPDNTSLARRIAQRGALVSEFPLGCGPERFRFPRRNRIISGLCRALVVVEAGKGSGALITASFALDQGREVFAVPGPIGSDASAGCHQLIADGARIFRDLGDLAAMIAPTLDRPVPSPRGADASAAPLTEEERRILGIFHGLPLSMDDIIRRAGLPPAAAMAGVLSLELRGTLRHYPGNRYLGAKGDR